MVNSDKRLDGLLTIQAIKRDALLTHCQPINHSNATVKVTGRTPEGSIA
jgi:hypothetical protein